MVGNDVVYVGARAPKWVIKRDNTFDYGIHALRVDLVS